MEGYRVGHRTKTPQAVTEPGMHGVWGTKRCNDNEGGYVVS